jgi:transmembrane sensor
MSSTNDHILASRIGEELEKGSIRGFMADADPLMGALHAFAAQSRAAAETEVGPEHRQRMWEQIAEATQASSESVTPRLLHTARPSWMWAAAALILVGLFAGLWQAGLIGGTAIGISGSEPVLLATSAETNFIYTFADGSTATLRPNSALYALPADRGTELLLDGEAYFAVTPQSDGRFFAVNSAETRVLVVGTRFNVRGWASHAEVFVDEGRVHVSRAKSDQIDLGAGQLGFVSDEGQLRRRNALSDEITGWMNAELIFRERSLTSITDELARHFGIRLDVDAAAGSITLTGRIFLENADQTLRELSLVSDVQLEKTSGNHYVITLP